AGEIRGERQRADSGERNGVGLEPAVDAVDAVLDLAKVGVAQFKAEVAGRLIAAEHLVSGVVFIDRPFVDHGLAHAHAGVEAGRLGRLGAEGGGAKRQCQKGGGYGVGLAHAVAPDCRRPEGEGMERQGPRWRCATAALRPNLASPACNAKRARQYPAFRKWNVAMPRSMTAPTAGRTRTLRAAALVIATVLLAACASAPQRNPIALWEGSPNHSTRWARAIVLHHTAMDSAEGAIRTLQTANSGGPVSAHYLVGEDGRVHQLVADGDAAWHAGNSRWAGVDELNAWSIGIELDNDGREPFPPAQIEALLVLLEDLSVRLRIPRHMVVGHSDIAPTRKDDPSVQFPWQALAR